MKFSEAIRLGAMLKPQAFGVFNGHRDVDVPGDVLGLRRVSKVSSCALAAAWDAVPSYTARIEWASMDGMVVSCPVGRTCPRAGVALTVVHLNDHHRWSRERIADWVASVEPSNAKSPSGAAVLVEIATQ